MSKSVCFTCTAGHHAADFGRVAAHARAARDRREHDTCPACLSPLAGEGAGLLAAGFLLAQMLFPEQRTH